MLMRSTFRPARNVDEYVDLVREAERRLIDLGYVTADDRIQILSGLYYGTDWSLDYDVERSQTRNVAFQGYTARAGQGPDPRPLLGESLFKALKRSQDVKHPRLGAVDIGHMIIGLNARSSWTSRAPEIPAHGATGLEIVTWVGDLGGATAQLARRRLSVPSTSARRYFTGAKGTDYGADSNLEGDLAAYVAGASSGATSASPLMVADGALIADALAGYFRTGGGTTDRATTFLKMLGGDFTGSTLRNRAEVERLMATKFRDFGRLYAAQRFGSSILSRLGPVLATAARDIATEFMNWLMRRTGRADPAANGGSRGGYSSPPDPPEPDLFDQAMEIYDWMRDDAYDWARELF